MRFIIISFLLVINVQAQQPGSLGLLSLPGNAIQSLEGGLSVASSSRSGWYRDVNPAHLGDSSALNAGIVSWSPFFAGINVANASFAMPVNGHHFGVQIGGLTYGSEEAFDASGQSMGRFSAGEVFTKISYGKKIAPFSMGASITFAQSSIGAYRNNALMLTGGLLYFGQKNDFTAGLVIGNLGGGFSNYGADVAVPFNLTLGTSFKPEYMPFRFSFTLTDLYAWDIRYPFDDLIPPVDFPGRISEALSIGFYHFRMGVELPIGEVVSVKAGYNHRLRQELRVGEIAGVSGFSLGSLIELRKMTIAYAASQYTLGGAMHLFTLSWNFNALFK